MAKEGISRRKVFYICGFDPRSARYYYNLYRSEAAKWTALTGKTLDITERSKSDEFSTSWQITNSADNVVCDYSFLVWDDIIREHWLRQPIKLLAATVTTYLGYLKNGDWSYVKNLSNRRFLVLFYPVIAFFLTVLLSIVVVVAAGSLLAPFMSETSLTVAKVGIALLVFLIGGYYLLVKIQSMWLLQLYIYHYKAFTHDPDQLDTRLDIFADYIVATLESETNDYDEILLIGHSHGSVLMPIIANRVLRKLSRDPPDSFKLVTLGQLLPLLTCLKSAHLFGADIKDLANYSIDWFDISSPADGACFSLTNPFEPLSDGGEVTVHLKSPRFHAVFNPQTYKRLKKDKLLLHFQYLCCGDILSPHNYIERTSGNTPLESIL